MGRKNVNLKTIAYELGVSINTVSHALRDMDDISEPTKQKVRRKAIEMGYISSAVSLNPKKTELPSVAILICSFDNLYFISFANQLASLFEKKGEFYCSFLCSSEINVEVIKQCVLQRIDLLVTHSCVDDETMEFAKINDIRIVVVGEKNVRTDVDCVTVDEQMGSKQAARYLYGLHSSRKFLYVGQEPVFDYRYKVFKSELASMGVTDVEYTCFDKNDTAKLYRYLDQGYRSVFAFNDHIAYNVLDDLDKMVVDVRRVYPDFHIVGFDGLCQSIAGMKQITTVSIDYERFTESVYKVVKQRLYDPNSPHHKIIVPVSLHQRNCKY